jgi:hypothetical protein
MTASLENDQVSSNISVVQTKQIQKCRLLLNKKVLVWIIFGTGCIVLSLIMLTCPTLLISKLVNDCPSSGDGICDDKQNIPKCGFDGLDCCLLFVDNSTCTICQCHLGKF